MDSRGNIYRATPEFVLPEDAARLDGYLRAKAEDGEMERMREQARRYESELRELRRLTED